MTFATDHSASTDQIGSYPASNTLRAGSVSWREWLAEADLAFVRRCAQTTRYGSVGHLAIMISKLGNGWVYPILLTVILMYVQRNALMILAIAALNATILHMIYPILKKRFRRRRPFQLDPGLNSLLGTLDEYSFPSGHVMTLSGVLLPVTLSIPGTALPALGLILIMGWSRIATAHHFPSDVLVGAVLGVIIASPISSWML